MMTLIAAALAAAQPAMAPAPAPAQDHMPMMEKGKAGQAGEHKGMDCCKDCCKDMAKMHEGHEAEKGAQPR
ncbi:MAG: hypothetical protein ABI770_07175 [Sphingomicrobium sp.]